MAQQRAFTLLCITLSSAVLLTSASPAAVASPLHTGLQDSSAAHHDEGHASPEPKDTSQPRLNACGWPVVPPPGSPKQQHSPANEHPSMPSMPPVGGGMISVNLPVPPLPAPQYRRRPSSSDAQTPSMWVPERMPDATSQANSMPRHPSSPPGPPCSPPSPSHAPNHSHAPETPPTTSPGHVHPAGEATSLLAGQAQEKGPAEGPNQAAERHKRPPLVIPTPDEFSWERRAAAGAGKGGPGSGPDGQGMAGTSGPGSTSSGMRGEGTLPGGMGAEDAPAGEGSQAQQQDPEEEDRRINLAAAADGASVVCANKEAKKPEKTIDGDDDSYMKNHCPAHKWLILELSQLGRVDEVELVNKEMYSSRVKDFTVKGRQSHPRKDGPASEFPRWFDTDTWHLLGHFTAANKKGDQMFRMQIPRRVRYILFQFHTHYGNEEMCALNSISVLGVSAAQELEEALAAHLDKHVHTTTTAGGRTHPGTGSAATGNHGTPPTPGAATVPPPPVIETGHGAASGVSEATVSPPEPADGTGGNVSPSAAPLSVHPSPSPPRTCMCEPGGAFLRPYTLTCARVCTKTSHGGSKHNGHDVVPGAGKGVTAPQDEEDEYLDDDSTGEDYDTSVAGELVGEGDMVLLPEPTPSLTEPLVASGSPAAGGRVTKATTGSCGSQLSTVPGVPGVPATPDPALGSHAKGHHPMPATGQHMEALDGEEQAVEASGHSHRHRLDDELCPATSSKAGVAADGTGVAPHGVPLKPPPDLVLPPPHPVLPPPDAHRSGTAIIPPIPAPGLASDSHQTVSTQPSTPPPGTGAPSPQPAPSTQCTMPPPQPAPELNAAVRKGDHHPHPSVTIDRPPAQPSTPSASQPPSAARPDPPRHHSEGVVSAGPGPGLLAEGGVWEQAGRMVLVPPPELPKSVVDGLLTSMEGGPAAKPKQAGNLFDIFKQEFVLLRLNQSRTWRYMTSLVEVLNKNAAEAAGELDAVEAAVAALELRLTTLPAQVEATVSRHLSRKYDQQLMRLTAGMEALQHEVALGRQCEWALLLYCSAVLAVVLAYSMHQSKSGSMGAAARVFRRLVLLLGVLNGLIGLTLHSPQLQQTLMLLLGMTSHAGSSN